MLKPRYKQHGFIRGGFIGHFGEWDCWHYDAVGGDAFIVENAHGDHFNATVRYFSSHTEGVASALRGALALWKALNDDPSISPLAKVKHD